MAPTPVPATPTPMPEPTEEDQETTSPTPEPASTPAAVSPLPSPDPTQQIVEPDTPTSVASAVSGTNIEPGLQPNGRLVSQQVENVDLDGDGVSEQVVTTSWHEVDGQSLALQVDIVTPEGDSLYRRAAWEPLGDPSTDDPGSIPLTAYDSVEALEIRDLIGNGSPQVIVQVRSPGTGQSLDVAIVRVIGGETDVLFEGQAYKGSMTFSDGGFSMNQPLYLYHEPNCCPCRIESIAYRWNGQGFEVTDHKVTAAEAESVSCPTFPEPARWQGLEIGGDWPSPRRDAALVFDRSQNRLILFGGMNGSTPLSDTWSFDLANRTWRLVDAGGPSSPPARFSMVSGVDELQGRLLITTGQAGPDQFFNDMWALDLASDSWQQLETGDAPPPRYGSAGGIFDYGNALYLSHGFTNQGRFNDLWAFNLETNSWQALSPAGEVPLERCLHAAAMTGPDEFVLFGGCSSGFGPCPQDDTWHWDGALASWQQLLQEAGPSARQFPAMAPLKDRNEVLLFGGQGQGSTDLGDTWVFDQIMEQWRQVTPEGEGPTARYSHSMIWVANLDPQMPGTGYVVLFGGNASGSDRNDLWILELGDL